MYCVWVFLSRPSRCINTYIHTFIHTYIHAYTNAYLHTNIHMNVHTFLHTYIHTYIQMYLPTYIHTYLPTYIHTYIHTNIHTNKHTYLHTRVRTCHYLHCAWISLSRRPKYVYIHTMGWIRLVGTLKVQVSIAEYKPFYRALLQKKPIILRSLRIVATPYTILIHYDTFVYTNEYIAQINTYTYSYAMTNWLVPCTYSLHYVKHA